MPFDSDDDFEYNDDEFGEDTQQTLVEIAQGKLLDSIEKVIKDLRGNLKYNERTDKEANLELLSGYTSAMLELSAIDEAGVSDEEAQAKIEEVFRKTTELTLSNIDSVINDPDEKDQTTEEIDDSDDGDPLDF
jgi:hypothetical protein